MLRSFVTRLTSPLFVALPLTLTLATSQVAVAKPYVTQGGCTSKQHTQAATKTEGGKQCVAKGAKEAEANLFGKGTGMASDIYCSSSGRFLCCQFKDGKPVDGTCETIKERTVTAPTKDQPGLQPDEATASPATDRPVLQSDEVAPSRTVPKIQSAD